MRPHNTFRRTSEAGLILVENGTPVEFGQALFRIEPAPRLDSGQG